MRMVLLKSVAVAGITCAASMLPLALPHPAAAQQNPTMSNVIPEVGGDDDSREDHRDQSGRAGDNAAGPFGEHRHRHGRTRRYGSTC